MRVETLPTGERVIVDPAVTNSRIVSELKDIDPATRSCLFDSQQCDGVLDIISYCWLNPRADSLDLYHAHLPKELC